MSIFTHFLPLISNPSRLTSYFATLRTVSTNSKVFLRGLLNMRKKQILTSVIEIPKEK